MESQYNVPPISHQETNPSAPDYDSLSTTLYPSLGEYMGLELTESVIAKNMPEYSLVNRNVSNITYSCTVVNVLRWSIYFRWQ